MLLKPRLSINLAMITAGALLTVIGFNAWKMTDDYWGIIPAIIGVFGLLWIFVGTIAIDRRNKMAIIINESEIELPSFKLFQKESQRLIIPREEIVLVTKHETIKGRLVEIKTKNHNKVMVQARHYCELNKFISYCREKGLPVA